MDFRSCIIWDQYDVGDRDHAYANAEGPIEQLLAENPSIEVVIDLHRMQWISIWCGR